MGSPEAPRGLTPRPEDDPRFPELVAKYSKASHPFFSPEQLASREIKKGEPVVYTTFRLERGTKEVVRFEPGSEPVVLREGIEESVTEPATRSGESKATESTKETPESVPAQGSLFA